MLLNVFYEMQHSNRVIGSISIETYVRDKMLAVNVVVLHTLKAFINHIFIITIDQTTRCNMKGAAHSDKYTDK